MSKRPNIDPELVAVSPSPRFMPPDWKPPPPAWSASFAQQATPVVMGYFGTQSHPSVSPTDNLREFFAGSNAPDNIEFAKYVDRAGFPTLL
jgi:hypothetical protein